MWKYFRALFVLTLFSVVALPAFGGSSSADYYAKAKAVSNGAGKVYVATTADAPSSDQYAASHEATNKTTQSGSSLPDNSNVTFYLFAQPDEGGMLDHWENEDGQNVSTANPYAVTISAAKDNESNPTTKTWTAVFTARSAVIASSAQPEYGKVEINKQKNEIGDNITVTATVLKPTTYGCINISVKFVGWFDQDDNLVSTDKKYSFIADRNIDLRAEFEIPQLVNGGFYRIYNFFGRALSVDGGFSKSWTNNNVMRGLLSWKTAEGFNYSNFHNTYLGSCMDEYEIETLPSTIIQLKGTVSADNQMTNAIAYAQGTNTQALTSKTFTIRNCPVQAAGLAPGSYYEIFNGSYALKYGVGNDMTVNVNGTAQNVKEGVIIVGNLATSSSGYAYQLLALHPIDREHVDDYWFGVHPDQEMEFDGGYWTSLYTSFPYECYEEDGVEAYYVKELAHANGKDWLVLEQIEEGIVPAETGVLLKCRSYESSRQNRLIPLNTLDPECPSIPAIEDNLLKGLYQLNKSESNPGHETFNSDKMKIFGVNAAGEVGFYRLEEGTTLTGNKVYLDLTNMTSEQKAAAMHISVGRPAGIECVESSESSTSEAIYDLSGRRVTKCEPGRIYIMNGKKVVRF